LIDAAVVSLEKNKDLLKSFFMPHAANPSNQQRQHHHPQTTAPPPSAPTAAAAIIIVLFFAYSKLHSWLDSAFHSAPLFEAQALGSN